MQHSLLSINPKTKEFDRDEAIERCYTWLTTEVPSTKCLNATAKKYETACTCSQDLNSPQEVERARAIAEYMVCWAGFPLHTKKELIFQWNQCSEVLAEDSEDYVKKRFTLPMCQYENCKLKRVCQNALRRVLNIGSKKWKSSILASLDETDKAEKTTFFSIISVRPFAKTLVFSTF